MTPEEIKIECDAAYEQIKNAEARLKELREKCKHEYTFRGNYSWRVGSTLPADICSSCGHVVMVIKDFS